MLVVLQIMTVIHLRHVKIVLRDTILQKVRRRAWRRNVIRTLARTGAYAPIAAVMEAAFHLVHTTVSVPPVMLAEASTTTTV